MQGRRRRRQAAACAAELAEVALRGRSGRTTQRAERRGEAVVRADYATVRAGRCRVAAVDRRKVMSSRDLGAEEGNGFILVAKGTG